MKLIAWLRLKIFGPKLSNYARGRKFAIEYAQRQPEGVPLELWLALLEARAEEATAFGAYNDFDRGVESIMAELRAGVPAVYLEIDPRPGPIAFESGGLTRAIQSTNVESYRGQPFIPLDRPEHIDSSSGARARTEVKAEPATAKPEAVQTKRRLRIRR